MKTRNSRAYQRLFKKFDALRATLPDDEREILDSIVKDEVTAHKMGRAVQKAVSRAKSKAIAKAPEVGAHKMGRAAQKAAAKAVAKASTKAASK